MKVPQWLLRLLNKNYVPRSTLTEKELEILDRLDHYLTSHSTQIPVNSVMVLKTTKINIFYAVKDTNSIADAVLKSLPEAVAYIPRSIAFFVDEEGSWCYIIAVREVGEVDAVTTKMFSQLLNTTNAARIK